MTEDTLRRLQDERVRQGLPRHITDGAALDAITLLVEGTPALVSAKKKTPRSARPVASRRVSSRATGRTPQG
jgi:hypothetical protein